MIMVWGINTPFHCQVKNLGHQPQLGEAGVEPLQQLSVVVLTSIVVSINVMTTCRSDEHMG